MEGEELRRTRVVLPNFVGMTSSKLAGQARELYSSHPIEECEIEEIDRPAAAVALARIKLRFKSRTWTALIRLCRFNGANPVAEWEPGAWKVNRYGVDPLADVRELNFKKQHRCTKSCRDGR